MKKLFLSICVLGSLLLQPALAKKGDHSDKYSPEQLAEAVDTRLSTLDGGVAVWVKGMICQSCGIGIRKKVSKLDFVDKAQLEKGVEMDVERMLLYVATKDGASVNPDELARAIKKAGYLPVSFFAYEGKELIRSELK